MLSSIAITYVIRQLAIVCAMNYEILVLMRSRVLITTHRLMGSAFIYYHYHHSEFINDKYRNPTDNQVFREKRAGNGFY